MSNPAQEEADRFFEHKTESTSHPEDRDDLASGTDEETAPRRTIRSSRREEIEDRDTDDDELAANMATMTTTKPSYVLPSTVHHANTGPKGVIADAQNYHRAKRSTFRRTLTNISDSLSLSTKARLQGRIPEKSTANGNSSDSDLDLDIGDDTDFMQQWRQQRLAELQDQFSTGNQSRAYSPSRRTYGTLDHVDANGYLDAVEKAPKETTVVVLLFDPHSKQSREVEDEVRMMAYKQSHIRFVKLHHQIAEMETVEIPAVLAYRDGDVFATISGAERDGLKDALKRQGVLGR